MTAGLQIQGLTAAYGRKVVLRGVDLAIAPGEIVALIGHNGAGKSTLLKAIFGAVRVTGGQVSWRGQRLSGRATAAAAQQGIRLVPEGTPVFADLTVAENLDLGTAPLGATRPQTGVLDFVFHLFPVLAQRRRQLAGTLSGGERKMLGIGMALVSSPDLLLLDEPSLGLAPVLVQELFDTIRRIQEERGLSILLVEQNVRQALRIVQRVYVMKLGHIIHAARPAELRGEAELLHLF